MKKIFYKSGYKYQLNADYTANIGEGSWRLIDTEFIRLTVDGELTIRRGYAWDGPSGPTVDTKNFMRGSLVHDALYQLMREGRLHKTNRKKADRLLQKICREDGMSSIRAWWVYQGVRFGGNSAASPSSRKVIKEAP